MLMNTILPNLIYEMARIACWPILLLFCCWQPMAAQSPVYHFQVSPDGQTLTDLRSGQLLAKGKTVATINEYPSLSGLMDIQPLALPSGSDLSVFVVFRSATEREECVWSVVVNDTTRQILTNQRLADLERGAYRDTPAGNYPTLGTYFRQDREDTDNPSADFGGEAPLNETNPGNLEVSESGNSPQLVFGQHPGLPELPVANFTGEVAEVLVYDRVLTPRNRQLIETRLALKYGITLRQEEPRHYLSTSGEVIWDALENRQYPHRIAGWLGTDTGTATSLRTRSTAVEGDALSMVLPREPLAGDYLVWSDNGEPTDLVAYEADRQWLSRRWILQSSGVPPGETLAVDLNTRRLFALVADDAPWRMFLFRDGETPFSASPWEVLEPVSATADGRLRWEIPSPYLMAGQSVYFTFGLAEPVKRPPPSASITDWRIAPNPARVAEPLNVRGVAPRPVAVRLEVHNALGRRVFVSDHEPTTHHQFDFTPQYPGTYLLHFTEAGQEITRRIVIHR